ncbi:MAG: T9SS type A sorting domain-containing protein [Bacteroidetes bacterium]|nr:T9SS type A sorting domain-containing protein [Bacteroidota bacterium]
MKLKNYFLLLVIAIFSFSVNAQEDIVPNVEQGANYIGTVTSMVHVTSIASRINEILPADISIREAQDRRSIRNKVIIGKDPQTWDDYLASNPDPSTQTIRVTPPILVFDAYSSGSSPTDPDMAIGPNHVFVTFNTGFTIYDKAGNQLLGQTSPNPAIFPSGGCCDLTVSYDNAADRWVVTFLGGGAQIAVSDGPDPINDGWYIYNIVSINDYQKLSVWSDGYYLTDNTGSVNKVWAMERTAMLAGNPGAGIQGFNLPGISTFGFYSPQAFHVTDDNLPAAGGATVVFLQDDAYPGVATDHIKLWTIDVDWVTPGNSTISAATEIATTSFISIFDGTSFSNLAQPGGGDDIDALQATIMQQAHFRRMGTHNSAIFNFVIDTDAGAGELAGVRWYEFRQTADNMPWTLYQEGTYTAPDGRHAWMADLAMDAAGNIGMGYTSMAGPTTPNPTDFRVSSYYTGRFDGDPLGTMTAIEEVIADGNANIPNFRYGDYSKIDVDPSDGATFWFINEYMSSGRTGVVGSFLLAPNTTTNDIGVTSIVTPVDGPLTANEDVTINIRNYGINDITNPNVNYDIDGGTPVVEMYVGTIPAETIVPFTFATQADLSAPGTYTITSSTLLAGDTNPGNDTATKDVTNGILYCTPSMDCSFGDGFQLVSIQEINNPSGCEGYADFTNLVANLNNGTTYDVTLTTGYGDQHVKVWIDFNDNGTFANDEVVVPNFIIAPGQGAGSYTVTVDLTIPVGASLGPHRMRFKSNWQAPVPDDACETTTFGETEDYTADIGTLGIEDQTIVEADLIVLSKANNQFDISLITDFDGTASIAIYNILGQTLAFNNIVKEGNAFNYQLDMSYASPGIYFIRIGSQASNTFKSAKIIVR